MCALYRVCCLPKSHGESLKDCGQGGDIVLCVLVTLAEARLVAGRSVFCNNLGKDHCSGKIYLGYRFEIESVVVLIHWLPSRGEGGVKSDSWTNGCCQSPRKRTQNCFPREDGLLDVIDLRDIN